MAGTGKGATASERARDELIPNFDAAITL